MNAKDEIVVVGGGGDQYQKLHQLHFHNKHKRAKRRGSTQPTEIGGWASCFASFKNQEE